MKKKRIERIFSFLCLAFTLGVVLVVGLRGNELEEMLAALSNLTPAWLLLCVLSWVLYVVANALSMYHFVRIQGQKIGFLQALHAAIVGIYYCNVTPGASGGQPMEMYYLSKYGVSVGVSGSGMAVKFVVFQVTLLIAGAVMWITHAGFVQEYAPGCTWFFLLGYVVNFFSIGMVMLMAVSQRAVRWVIERVIRIGVRFHLCKTPDESRLKWENHCRNFLESVQQVIHKPRDLVIQCLIALLQLFSLMAVIVAVYFALGLQGVNISSLVTMGVLLYIGASYTPLPGASGAQEGGFAMLFHSIFPDANCFVALLLWRFFTYYLSIIAGAAVTVGESLITVRKGNKTLEIHKQSN